MELTFSCDLLEMMLKDHFDNEFTWINTYSFFPGYDSYYCYGQTLMLRISGKKSVIEFGLKDFDPEHGCFSTKLHMYPYKKSEEARWCVVNFINRLTKIDKQKNMYNYKLKENSHGYVFGLYDVKVSERKHSDDYYTDLFYYYEAVAIKIRDLFADMYEEEIKPYVKKLQGIVYDETSEVIEQVNEYTKKIKHTIDFKPAGKEILPIKFIPADEPIPETKTVITLNDYNPEDKVDPNKLNVHGHKIMNEIISIPWAHDPLHYYMDYEHARIQCVRNKGSPLYKPISYADTVKLIDSIDWSEIEVSYAYCRCKTHSYVINPLQLDKVFNMIMEKLEVLE